MKEEGLCITRRRRGEIMSWFTRRRRRWDDEAKGIGKGKSCELGNGGGKKLRRSEMGLRHRFTVKKKERGRDEMECNIMWIWEWKEEIECENKRKKRQTRPK